MNRPSSDLSKQSLKINQFQRRLLLSAKRKLERSAEGNEPGNDLRPDIGSSSLAADNFFWFHLL
ncbi:MAG: hypothetical protein ACOY90_13945 [Candidatus Zhuqueibacterota bacterium]